MTPETLALSEFLGAWILGGLVVAGCSFVAFVCLTHKEAEDAAEEHLRADIVWEGTREPQGRRA